MPQNKKIMTITLYLQKETLLRDLQTLSFITTTSIKGAENLRDRFDKLNISTQKSTKNEIVAIQVTPEEFALIGVFNGGI